MGGGWTADSDQRRPERTQRGGRAEGRCACQVGCPPPQGSPAKEPALAKAKCWVFPRPGGGGRAGAGGEKLSLCKGPVSLRLSASQHQPASVRLPPSFPPPTPNSAEDCAARPPAPLSSGDPASQRPRRSVCRSRTHSPACRPPASGLLSGAALLGGVSESV